MFFIFQQDTTFSTEMVESRVKTSKDWIKTWASWATLCGNVWENKTYVRIEYLTIPNNPDLHKLLQLKDEETPSLAWEKTPKNGVLCVCRLQNSSRLRPFSTFECSVLVYYQRSVTHVLGVLWNSSRLVILYVIFKTPAKNKKGWNTFRCLSRGFRCLMFEETTTATGIEHRR